MKKHKFYIYHLRDIKIGCTISPSKRFLDNQRKYGKQNKHKILFCGYLTIDEATEKEANLAREHGYINHSPYKHTFKNSLEISKSSEIKKKMSDNHWLKTGECSQEYRDKMRKSIIRRNKKMGAKGREKLASGLKEKNSYAGGNYYLDKTKEELLEISRKRSVTNKQNKDNHLYKGGTKVSIGGIVYKSINKASKDIGVSFKYLKRRVTLEDYKDYYFV